jgi:hypothetical protein
MNVPTINDGKENKEISFLSQDSTGEDYYNIAALSASGINLFHKSPLHYWSESPFNPNRIIQTSTEEMLLGKVIHKLIFEQDTFEKEFIIEPKFDRRTKLGKKEAESFSLENINKQIINQNIYNEAMRLSQGIWRNSAVKKLIGNGCPEKPIYWNKNGLPCKAKLDYYREGLIIDYKSSRTADVKNFTKSLITYGYHRQASWYMEGIETVLGERPRGFIFIVQDKTLPDAIGIYALDEESLRIARNENLFVVQQVIKRLNNNQWEAFPNYIQEISLPSWYVSTINDRVETVYV